MAVLKIRTLPDPVLRQKARKVNKITFHGSEKDIAVAAEVLKHKRLKNLTEADARLKIQLLIDQQHLKAAILVNGNNVWSKERILRNLRRIMKVGILYNHDQRKPPILSHYFYQFLHEVCGSISHYDIHGWIHKYSTVEHLKRFFKRNEFGKPVRDWIPGWYTDAKRIVEEIEEKLFPFQTFLKNKNN